MAVTGGSEASAFDAAAQAEIARVRASGALGRSGRLLELFDFLVERSAVGESPKEVEIAVSVFGKSSAEDLRDDPIARVYIHRLRKRLDEFYGAAPRGSGARRLDVPKGEYRIIHAGLECDELLAPTSASGRFGRFVARGRALLDRYPGRAVGAVAAALLALNVIAWIAVWSVSGATSGNLAELRRHPVWAPLTQSGRPLTIVVGDYYMFGEFYDGIFLQRLVRDFSINSREALLEHQRFNPETYATYGDVNLRYLPTSVGEALAHVAPIAPEGKPARVILASELTPETLRDSDIIYLGLFSGLSGLLEPVFAASRFEFGDSYDEIRDRETGEQFRSDAFVSSPLDAMYSDYALFASLDGPTGNRILVLAGARDAGLEGVAERLANLDALGELSHFAGGGASYEALYRIHGRDQVSIESEMVVSSPVDTARVWSAEYPPLRFPTQ